MKGIGPKVTQLHAATQFAYLHLQESLCEKLKLVTQNHCYFMIALSYTSITVNPSKNLERSFVWVLD